MNFNLKDIRLILTIIILIITFSIATILFGKSSISLAELWSWFLGNDVSASTKQIIINLRIPRLLVAILTGAMLGLAGAILQNLTKNSLAEPSLIGITNGGVLTIVLFTSFAPSTLINNIFISFFSCIGALLVTYLVMLISHSTSKSHTQIALIGVFVSSILQAITALILLIRQDAMGSILFWVVGSLNGRVWDHVMVLIPFALIGLTLGLMSSSIANVLRLGDVQASILGVSVKNTRIILMGLAAILTAGAVSVVGAIGFIGLIGPHVAKKFVGEDARKSFPLSVLLSALLLVVADFTAQNLIIAVPFESFNPDAQLPAGAITAVIGVPFFLYILHQQKLRRAS